MDVVFSVAGEVIVDDQRHLLDVDTTGQQVGSDQYTARAGPELAHNNITLLKNIASKASSTQSEIANNNKVKNTFGQEKGEKILN